ncbi:MAG: hypothetical protein PHE83_11605 [Opitutaceae bacterium]|nr:hypothetical protein [Opitutaceae bacterium]
MKFPRIVPVMFFLTGVIPIPGFGTNGPDRTSLVCSGITVCYDRMDEDFTRKFCERLPSLRNQVFNALQTGVGKVLETQLADDPSNKWIWVGGAPCVARRVLVEITSPQVADRYTALFDRLLQGAKQDATPISLEAWPAEQETRHVAVAVQIFRNIAEKHGNAAVTQLLAEFWKLPPERRTSIEFRQLYRKLFREPLEAEAPSGVRFGAG